MKREYTIKETIALEEDEYLKCPYCGQAPPIRETDVDPYKQEYFYFVCPDCGSYSDCCFEGEEIVLN